ncbi:MAG: FAD-dependent monooxygenase [Gammaproteobacteria bacterium]
MQTSIPVLIVGAGPSGLTMALELQRYGIPFRIIDKQIKPVSTSNALAVHPRTLEVWDDMGFLSEGLALGTRVSGGNIYSGRKKLAHIDFSHLDTDYPFILGLAQRVTEAMLINQLKKHQIAVEMEVDLININQDDTGVNLTLRHSHGDEEVHANWLIACDGSHSVIRQLLKIPFEGKELPQHFVLADLVIQSDLSQEELNLFNSEHGLFAIIPFDKIYSRVIAEVSNDSELREAKTITEAQLKRLFAQRCPFNLKFSKPIWTSGFWIHERIIPNYRHHKIFFVGDAAHVHSPAGGQGMNTGIQDAYNLAWKLAYLIQRKAKFSILETYQTERYPIGKQVLHDTSLLTKFMALHNSLLQKLRNFMIGLIGKSKIVRQSFAEKISMINIHYQDSILVKDCIPHAGGPRAGMRMLDIHYGDQRLFELVRGTKFVLLIFSGISGHTNIFNFLQLQGSILEQYKEMLQCVLINTQDEFSEWNHAKIFDNDLKVHKRYEVTQSSLYLIRPDKYIGFRGMIEDQEELEKYLDAVLISEL